MIIIGAEKMVGKSGPKHKEGRIVVHTEKVGSTTYVYVVFFSSRRRHSQLKYRGLFCCVRTVLYVTPTVAAKNVYTKQNPDKRGIMFTYSKKTSLLEQCCIIRLILLTHYTAVPQV